ncbi:MAG: hypothetical protein GY778_05355 [bacterium]|nr:hypothetical protein [bacterium]
MRLARVSIAAAAVAALLIPFASATAADRWEAAIQQFEERDKTSPPPKGGIVFIGSSSIRKWDLDQYFPGLQVVNRGFGGSQMADSVRYADRILIPYEPRVVVVYAGDNDINAGKSSGQVFADYQSFVTKVHGSLPKTKIIFVAIKPSLKRWNLVEKMRRANGMVREAAAKDPRLEYLDIDQPMMGADGRPRPELFAADGLHLSPQGYELWTSRLRPLLTGK